MSDSYFSLKNKSSYKEILVDNKFFLIGVILLVILVFFNTLKNDFSVIDDLAGFVNSPSIRSFSTSFKTLQIQQIIYSLSYNLFGVTPLPLRLFAIFNHSAVMVLSFISIHTLFNKKTARLTALLFAVHPLVTEPINWVSGQFYIVMAIFFYTTLLIFIKYRTTNNPNYLYATIGLILLNIITIRHIWVTVIPLMLFTIDLLLLKTKPVSRVLRSMAIILILTCLFLFLFNFQNAIYTRLKDRAPESGRQVVNQQALIPVLEGYPFTIYSLVRLTLFPKDLTIYYDGNKMNSVTYFAMYAIFALYVGTLLIAIYKKNFTLMGLLIIPLVSIAAVLSPKKVTWFISERYLYLGLPFSITLISLALQYLEKKTKIRNLSLYLMALIVILFSIRTYIRNADWKTSETLALATISVSPDGIRPYNDLAGYYALQKRYDEAKVWYSKSLKIHEGQVATRNLGYIYLISGLDPQIKTSKLNDIDMKNQINSYIASKDYLNAIYLLNELYSRNQKDINSINQIANIFIENGSYDKANEYLNKSLAINPDYPDTIYNTAFLAYKKGDFSKAATLLKEVLELNPTHPGALQGMQAVLKQSQ